MIGEKTKLFYDKLCNFISENGYSPSVREMCKYANIKSTATVFKNFNILREEGLIEKTNKRSRVIKLANSVSYRSVPVVGTVTAGIPILAEQNIDSYFPIANNFARNRDLFILRVQGNSMIEKHICDKDLLIVQSQSEAKNGDIVVAMIDGSATVKTFFKEKDCFKLMPANPDFEPIIVKELQILGIAVGLFREL